jgi:hypothetical protein
LDFKVLDYHRHKGADVNDETLLAARQREPAALPVIDEPAKGS